MGVCSVNKVQRIGDISQIVEPVSQYRIELFRWVKIVHEICTSCNIGIETCVLNGQERKAVIIKAKQFYLRTISKLLQESIKKCDYLIEVSTSMLERSKKLKEMKQSWLSVNEFMLTNDITQILEEDLEDLHILEVEHLLQDELRDHELEIMGELKRQTDRIKKLNKDSTYARRKYSKQKVI